MLVRIHSVGDTTPELFTYVVHHQDQMYCSIDLVPHCLLPEQSLTILHYMLSFITTRILPLIHSRCATY
ncbi:hypothetical protein AQUCO_00700841v1 [Aquilegia coerulea]|uniref:Uncharacterized protein n=1 Tax=Aquilegia coerulea TaxID=218851 RepID=A0A2G5ELX8_AQUCA|nr:hypothetical protein AQUCO_00700841v1 [Aquilegia coerulea]